MSQEKENRQYENAQSVQEGQQPHKRRVRYKGRYPKKYEEKYKELQPEKYQDTIQHVMQKGNTPAGMHISIMVKEIIDFLEPGDCLVLNDSCVLPARLFGVKGPATGDGESLNPVSSRTGVEIMSINLLLDDPEAPVVWRGPVIAGAVKQFWQEVVWDVDFLFVDMPPGTGDVPLTVFQTLPVDGIVIVSSPQELVGMIVGKAVQMAQMMHVPILGLVENMSYAVCPDCGKHINVFGDSHVDEIADKYKLPVLAKMPIDPELAKEADAGMIEMFAGDYLDNAAQTVAKLLKK